MEDMNSKDSIHLRSPKEMIEEALRSVQGNQRRVIENNLLSRDSMRRNFRSLQKQESKTSSGPDK